MSPQAQEFIWLLAVLAPVLVCLLAKATDALGLAAMLLLTWCLGRVLWAFYTPPESMQLYPVIDAICGGVAFAAWRSQRAFWKLCLVALFIGQCALHAAFWLSQPQQASALYRYIVANNILFASELMVVTLGGLNDLARGAFTGLFDCARRLRHARFGR